MSYFTLKSSKVVSFRSRRLVRSQNPIASDGRRLRYWSSR